MVTCILLTLCIFLSIKESYQKCRGYADNIVICSNISQSNVDELNGGRYSRLRNELLVNNSNIQILPANFVSPFIIMHLEGISISRVTPGAFSNQGHLKELYLKDNKLTNINNGVFNKLTNLQILDLHNNRIEEIEENALIGLNMLYKLLLNNNNFTKLPINLFDAIRNLEYLDISHNNINSLDHMLFIGNIHLTSLYLNNNNITNIPENIFDHNVKLLSLDLSYNPIKHINYDMFLNLHNLSMINVSFTERQSVFYSNMSSLFRVSHLSLDGKNIKDIDMANKNVYSVSLSQNNLSYINVTTFEHCAYLTYLNLSINNIDEIDRGAFFYLKSLKTLDLSNNKIQLLPHGLFSELLNLQLLDISANLIQTLNYGIFDSLRNLNYLDISSNEISSFAPFTFHSLRNLKVFYLDNNNIAYLDAENITAQLTSLNIISFDNNLWSCSVLVKLVHDLEKKHIKVREGNVSYSHNVNKIKCEETVSLEINNNNNTKNSTAYSEIRQIYPTINDKAYANNLHTFLNSEFKDTKFYHFFKNFIDYQVPSVANINTTNTTDKSVAYKLVDNENYKNVSYRRLEVVLYLIFVIQLAKFSFTLYTFFNKKPFKTNGGCHTLEFAESQTELL